MDNVGTRVASITDLDVVSELFDLYRQFYEQAPDLPLARQFIRERLENHESVILLAFGKDQEATGFCQLYPTFCSVEAKPIFALYDLFVIPGARKTGTGKLLLRAAEQHARENGKVRMDLMTAKTNQPAQSLYESLGWVREEAFDAYSRRIAA